MTIDGKPISDAERLRLMLEEELEATDNCLEYRHGMVSTPARETESAQTQGVSAPTLDDDSDWPAARFKELVARIHELDQNENEVRT